MDRLELSNIILKKLENHESDIKAVIKNSKNKIGYFYIDNLLPVNYVKSLFDTFPKSKNMLLKKSIREHKYVGVQMNQYNALLEEAIYSFQNQKIVKFIKDAFELKAVYPDPNLYAGGLSMMEKNHFLNPHIDNSHDKDRNRWRVLNLLYYVTPDWEMDYGGNLEIWSDGLQNKPITIHSKFNRLIVMSTHNQSWHSVSPITYNGQRCCISNYYFSDFPINNKNKFHVTSFRGRPKQKIYDIILQFDNYIRMLIRKFAKKGIVKQKHIYNKKNR